MMRPTGEILRNGDEPPKGDQSLTPTNEGLFVGALGVRLTFILYHFSLGMVNRCLMENRKEEIARDLFPGALEMMILESLRRQPAHGYALVQHIQQRSKNLLQVEEGSLYPALQRLLKAKLVRAEWTVSSSTNRRVRVYEITRTGLSHLEREISRFDRMLEGVQMVLGPARGTANS
jgi:PadR family transcriptional regulator PadR